MKNTLSNLKRVFNYGKKYNKSFIIFTIISIINIGVNIVYPIITARQLVALSNSLFMEVFIASLICLGFSLMCDFTTVILRKNTQIYFRGVTREIQMDAAKEILNIELSNIDSHGTGTFITRISSDADYMGHIFTRGMGMLTSIFTDIGIYVAAFLINKLVFCYFVMASLLLTILNLVKIKNVNEEDKKYRHQREKTTSLVSELVRGIRDIKMLYAKESFTEEIDANIDELTKRQYDVRNTEIGFNLVIDVINDLVDFFFIVLLIYLISSNILLVGTALVLYNYRYHVITDLMYKFGELLEELRNFNLSCNRLFQLFDSRVFSKEKFGCKHLDKFEGNFEFKNVKFGYDDTKVLKGMSFKVGTKETVAFVGKSGVGKTTIFSLLCKLYNIDSGRILLDGVNINDLDEESIRNNITIISQSPYIFNLSIKDNFRLVKKNVTIDEIKDACKMACLDEFIVSLPNGYDTIVGEGGINLSGGQRQRLAIARAFVQDTKIILFDEATSALDNETQMSIQSAINNMKDRYTILIIAHRLSTIVGADKIMLVSDGKISDVGSHKELLKRNKEYKKLYESEIFED